MNRVAKRAVVALGVAGLGVLFWPGPATAETSLGGYSATAVAEPVRIEIFEPTIPIPSSPEIDGGIAYTQANVDTGPSSRALASYLWPGPVVGDGFGTVVGNDAAKYPVQVNSKDPATKDAPAQNTAQLTKGNGMTTEATDSETKATATGLGIAGPDTDLLGGIGAGLGQLGGAAPSTTPTPPVPVPVGSTLSGIVTTGAVKSISDLILGKNSMTSTATAYVSDVKLLGGVVTIGAVNLVSTTVSDGKKATNTATVQVGDVKVAGMDLGLTDKGISLAGTTVKLPTIPSSGQSVLSMLGISIKVAQTQKSVSGATGNFGAQGLDISIDTKPLKKLLDTSAITDPLASALSKIPGLGDQIGPVLALGPKIEVVLGNVATMATASPAYTGSTTTTGATTGSTTSSTGSGGGTTGGSTSGGTSGGGAISSGGGSIGGTSGGLAGGTGGTTGGGTTGTGTAPLTSPVADSGLNLPGLGSTPKILILGGLLLAAGAAWLLNNLGSMLFGLGGGCDRGLESGVPDLRKGQ